MFRVSFISIFVVYKVDSESNNVTWGPLKIVQQWPCKVSLHIYTIPIYTEERSEIQLEFYNCMCVCVCVREREREILHLLDSPMKIQKMFMVIVNSLGVDEGFLEWQGGIIELINSYKYSWGNLASNGNLITTNRIPIFMNLWDNKRKKKLEEITILSDVN